MRITERMRFQVPGVRIARLNSRRAAATAQISSGRRLMRPSDDPTASLKANRLETERARLDQYARNQDAATGRLTKVDGVLGEATNALLRIKELTIGSLTSVASQDDLDIMAAEVEQLTEHLRALMNTRGADGGYVFGGLRTDRPPYLAGPPPVFQGDPSVMQLEVSQSVRLDVGPRGGAAFGDGTANTVDTFANLQRLADNIRAGVEAPIQDELEVLETAISQSVDVRAEVGMKMERLDGVRSLTELLDERAQADLAALSDADMPKAISELQLVENALQATLTASGRSMSGGSLLDFLR